MIELKRGNHVITKDGREGRICAITPWKIDDNIAVEIIKGRNKGDIKFFKKHEVYPTGLEKFAFNE